MAVWSTVKLSLLEIVDFIFLQTDEENKFITLFRQLCRSRSDWQVWSDLINVFACSISNSLDRVPEHFEAREKEYEDCIQRLGSVEIAAKLFSMVILALERNPEQDFLGKLYMKLSSQPLLYLRYKA